jgi:hypothetical protein
VIRLKTTIMPMLMCLMLSVATTLHAQERMRTGMWEDTVTASGHTATRTDIPGFPYPPESNRPGH